jgi:type IV pilus assembly protein PilY1
MTRKLSIAAVVAACALLPATVYAQLVIKDDFTGAAAQNSWIATNGACLTAGNNTGSVPACKGLAYYGTETLVGGAKGSLPDTVGSGALRFTNGFPGGYNQNGAIVSTLAPAFTTKQGVQVTFTTETYLGDSKGGGSDGADGISFFLMDASKPAGIGAFGGSLGYSCSDNNSPYDGLVGGYIAVGVDEFGNFLNGGTTRSSTFPDNGPDNTASGWGYEPNRIGLRGAGNVSWAWLTANHPELYPSSLATTLSNITVNFHNDPKQAQLAPYSWLATQAACSTGFLSDYNKPASPVQTTTPVMDYPAIPFAHTVLSGVKIANESATTRGLGTPITYKLKITSDGLLSFSYSLNGAAYQSVITNQDITLSNGKLPNGLQFGFAGSTGGSDNIHEIMCFQASPADVSASSVGLNQQQGQKVQAGTQVYFAFYNPNNWAGGLTANNFVISNGTVAISTVANWDASCVLTGVATGQICPTTNGGPSTAQDWTKRTAITFNDDSRAGVPFNFPSLSTAQQSALDPTATLTSTRLNYLRGDRSNEVTATNANAFRARAGVLGDILDSSPTWVGPPSAPYMTKWTDTLHPTATMPENTGTSYLTFMTGTAKTRTNVVYAGANDGFLHGFRAGAFKADGTYDATQNDGTEVLAYMPGSIVRSIHNSTTPGLDFSDPHYGHNFYVDATPGTGEVFWGGNWYTWLVGGLGGSPGIYVLDVTDPSQFGTSTSQAGSTVVAEWTPTGIPGGCAGSSSCGDNMGNIGGVPQIRRFHNGGWGAIIPNGVGSISGDAGIFILLIDPASKTTPSVSLRYISATGNSKTKVGTNGIVYATAADLDGDHITDYVYAGDIQGNVWRFDLTDTDPSNWVASASALFKAAGPITTKPVVVSVPSATGFPRVMVEFGTGQQTPITNTTAPAYATSPQSLYGIWDWNMTAWNARPSIKYANAAKLASGATLVQQTISSPATGFRSVTNKAVCWMDVPTCAATPQYGWQDPLPDTSVTPSSSGAITNYEQVIFSPIFEVGAFIVNTTVPAANSPTTCTVTTPTGWTMAISPENGGSFTTSFFPSPNGTFTTINNQTISGVEWNGTGTPTIVVIGDDRIGDPNPPGVNGTYLATQTTGGNGDVGKVNPPPSTQGQRLTWIERR